MLVFMNVLEDQIGLDTMLINYTDFFFLFLFLHAQCSRFLVGSNFKDRLLFIERQI